MIPEGFDIRNASPTTQLLFALQVLLQIALFIAAMVSIIRKPVAFLSKLPWMLLSCVNIIGPILYFIFGSKRLDQAAESADFEL